LRWGQSLIINFQLKKMALSVELQILEVYYR